MELHDKNNTAAVVVAIVHDDDGDEDKVKTIIMCSEMK